jgi:hypothetical protein
MLGSGTTSMYITNTNEPLGLCGGRERLMIFYLMLMNVNEIKYIIYYVGIELMLNSLDIIIITKE